MEIIQAIIGYVLAIVFSYQVIGAWRNGNDFAFAAQIVAAITFLTFALTHAVKIWW